MKLHANSLTRADLREAANFASTKGDGNVYLAMADEAGSVSRARSFNVALEGDGSVTRRRRNWGTSMQNGSLGYSATYDSWGWFFAYLYALDSSLVCGTGKGAVYRDAADFHAKTEGKYALVVAS